MKFYNREKETKMLRDIERVSVKYAQMTVITGRRRIGKTTLVKGAFQKTKCIYFFVGRKSEALLCNELTEIVNDVLGEQLGTFTSMALLFKSLMNISKRLNFTLVFDEFQDFKYVNESFFSDMQNIWDSNKDESNMNLVICGSIYSMMTKIFDDRKEPLYGRATNRIRLMPFTIATMKDILKDCYPHYTSEDLLAFYMITGGVAKYVEQLVTWDAFTKKDILSTVLNYGSYFINEGKELLSDEFGKDYGNYFSILSAISSGYTGRGDITNYTNVEAGGFLDKLETIYDLIYRVRPFMASEGSRNTKYGLHDNFLTFWFRFIYKYRSALEIGNLDFIREKVEADYDTYSGLILERYFRQKYRETGRYNLVTNYWEKNGQNEIDLIAMNDIDKEIVIGECKRNPKRISLNVLKDKSANIVAKKKAYKISYIALSLRDM
jgi:AAA+ ATPase superfamily predicted ATPase